MKFFKYIVLITLSTNLIAGPGNSQLDGSTIKSFQKTNWSKIAQNTLYGTVLVGAVASFLFWLPPTCDIINQLGVQAAVERTLIPRLIIDALTIGACANGLYQTNSNKQDLSGVKSLQDLSPVRSGLDTSLDTSSSGQAKQFKNLHH